MTNQDSIIIDVRTEEEFDGGHLEGAFNIPLSVIMRGVNPECDFETKILVHCASGARSERAKQILFNRGFKNITNTCTIEETKKLIK